MAVALAVRWICGLDPTGCQTKCLRHFERDKVVEMVGGPSCAESADTATGCRVDPRRNTVAAVYDRRRGFKAGFGDPALQKPAIIDRRYRCASVQFRAQPFFILRLRPPGVARGPNPSARFLSDGGRPSAGLHAEPRFLRIRHFFSPASTGTFLAASALAAVVNVNFVLHAGQIVLPF